MDGFHLESSFRLYEGFLRLSRKFCYAERLTERWGKKFSEIKLHPERLAQPLRWRKPRRIFVCSMSDMFHEDIPLEFLARVFDVMASATLGCNKRHKHEGECWIGEPHIFQVPTKRAERMQRVMTHDLPAHAAEYWPGDSAIGMALSRWPLKNVWLGVSTENQEMADKRIPLLLRTPATIRFVSVEPLLSPVDLTRYVCAGISWCIVGGESGPDHRPMKIEWVRSIVDQCIWAGVPVFVKQDSGRLPGKQGRLPDDLWRYKELPISDHFQIRFD